MMCRSELRGLGALHRKLASAAGALLTVSTDSVQDSRRLAEKLKLPFDLLSDSEAEVVRGYGLQMHEPYQNLTVAIPASFLIDKSGNLVWRHVSATVNDRAAPAEVEIAIDRLLP